MNLNEKIRKATTHISQNEGLIFEKSSPGKKDVYKRQTAKCFSTTSCITGRNWEFICG